MNLSGSALLKIINYVVVCGSKTFIYLLIFVLVKRSKLVHFRKKK